jgi:hypothetical protein
MSSFDVASPATSAPAVSLGSLGEHVEALAKPSGEKQPGHIAHHTANLTSTAGEWMALLEGGSNHAPDITDYVKRHSMTIIFNLDKIPGAAVREKTNPSLRSECIIGILDQLNHGHNVIRDEICPERGKDASDACETG